jgi:hypothetical protein
MRWAEGDDHHDLPTVPLSTLDVKALRSGLFPERDLRR